ncbi:pilus assembly protein N-terminal domain-containing protein [Pleomorphomonas sp. NRK KF1]|uniref:pilus assembly protein N-terminal domain-containing protein n=1 Tax=Pleomorphomonas sp. NRK KF1 TaxID=2943000 RepID=UPI002043ABB3|nr:pilus assembly protein N-terminal domain-containing protein [Pleomorphomonas sp. NRK KF1]MCM5554373.1 pilus assembly protein N-terminal domain-containing protein [Pleomorphomonas sp. NRK KF1]
MSSRLVRSALLAAVVIGTVGAPVASGAADMVKVELDQARIYRLAAPASTIVIGNPAIADATLQDAQTLIVTGRAYGQTNLIVLDEQGETITDVQLAVLAATENLVTVYKGAKRQSLSCLPDCQPAAVPGDDSQHFGGILGQVAQHNGSGSGAPTTTATGASGNSSGASVPAAPNSQ